jgi:hypothetical protein
LATLEVESAGFPKWMPDGKSLSFLTLEEVDSNWYMTGKRWSPRVEIEAPW